MAGKYSVNLSMRDELEEDGIISPQVRIQVISSSRGNFKEMVLISQFMLLCTYR